MSELVSPVLVRQLSRNVEVGCFVLSKQLVYKYGILIPRHKSTHSQPLIGSTRAVVFHLNRAASAFDIILLRVLSAAHRFTLK